jgi:beta-barrel assembly-enhancing protease
MNDIVSRRGVLAGLGCICCAGMTGIAEARIPPQQMEPLIGPGHQPTDRDEVGMWQQYQRVEQEIADSNLLIKDEAIIEYLRQVVTRVGGPAAKDMRIYLARVPEFNAFMAPTGFMVVFTGLLTRMRDEAQLSGVIAHEAGHFLRRHHIRAWRDLRRKTNLLNFLAIGAGIGGAAAGVYAGDLVRLAAFGTMLSLAAYSREMEAEADALGLRLIAENGYDPTSMPEIWQQLIQEMDATAEMRNRRRDRRYSLLASHPAPETRMADLRASAQELKASTGAEDRGRERYLEAIGPYRRMLLDDQVKLNDPGASLFIVRNLAKDGWTGMLRYFEGEVFRLRGAAGDPALSAQSYAAAVQFEDAPPEAWRAHGYALIRAGSPQPGREALNRYLALAPDAPDAPMVRHMISQ